MYDVVDVDTLNVLDTDAGVRVLDNIIDKDLWVLVKWRGPNISYGLWIQLYTDDYYNRFDKSWYPAKYTPAYTYNSTYYGLIDNASDGRLSKRDINVVSPIEILSSAELQEIGELCQSESRNANRYEFYGE